MKSFVVMQGHTYQEEKELGIIWSPQEDRGGNVPHSWLRMTEVVAGDRVFHYVRGYIVAISVAITECKTASKPSEFRRHFAASTN